VEVGELRAIVAIDGGSSMQRNQTRKPSEGSAVQTQPLPPFWGASDQTKPVMVGGLDCRASRKSLRSGTTWLSWIIGAVVKKKLDAELVRPEDGLRRGQEGSGGGGGGGGGGLRSR